MPTLALTTSHQNISIVGLGINPSAVGRVFFHECLEQDMESTFFNPTEFAITCVYTHVTGESYSINALKNYPHTGASVSDVDVSTKEMILKVQERKLKRTPKVGDTIVAEGIPYSVQDYQPDGVGVVDLICTIRGAV